MPELNKDIDLVDFLKNTSRFVKDIDREGIPAKVITIERIYDTTINDLWDAITNEERLSRWFLPVSGDLKKGGHYKLEGNAEGTITECNIPNSFSLTWEFGGVVSWVTVYLVESFKGSTKLKLEHLSLVSPFWRTYGPGASGVGWDLLLLGLLLYLKYPDRPKPNEVEWSVSPEGKEFITQSSENWGETAIVGGETKEVAKKAVKQTTAFFTGTKVEL